MTRFTTLVLIVFVGCVSGWSETGVWQTKFETPEAAVNALVDAARSGSTDALRPIFGTGADAVLDSGDAVQARNDLKAFVARYDRQHKIVKNDDGSRSLVIGKNEWPFPIPLVPHGKQWRFDAEEGHEEILARRIGRNELTTIEVCRAILDAQQEYRALAPEGSKAYAAKAWSDEGKKNGLYWPVAADAEPSPLGELVATAAAEGYERSKTEKRAPYRGYLYRILTRQGAAAPGGERTYVVDGRMSRGHAVIAWPAKYGESGVMTFIVNHQGIIYQRDLGEDTATIAAAIGAFNPHSDWEVCTD